MNTFFPGFKKRRIRTSGAAINLVHGGVGPPLLLLHGYPQTHAIWHKVAPELAKRFSVVAADLRGYGDSEKPHGLPDHANYSKRAMAQDQVEVMRALGHEEFFVVGHDRGGRVAHRMALDHPAQVLRLAVLDIIPTRTMYQRVTREFAKLLPLVLPAPSGAHPRDADRREPGLLSREPHRNAARRVEGVRARGAGRVPQVLSRSGGDPRELRGLPRRRVDRSGARRGRSRAQARLPAARAVGKHGTIERCFKPLADWAERAESVQGRTLDCGHYLPEEAPTELLGELVTFFT